jgi:hypothetical protein
MTATRITGTPQDPTAASQLKKRSRITGWIYAPDTPSSSRETATLPVGAIRMDPS